jgi:hypothetical protein
MARALSQNGTQMLFTRWSPVNRVDLYRAATPRVTFWARVGRSSQYPGPFPPALSIQYDAHNGSAVYRVEGPDSLRLLDRHLLRTPYLLQEEPRVLVIGVGGGVDILNALRRNASEITAVELQPITVELHNGMLAGWTGGQIQRPEVNLLAGEGRHFVRSQGGTYDLIQITATDTFSAQSTGAYVLAESYLYTVEAFEDYLDHLAEGGIVSTVLGDILYRDPKYPTPLSTRLALTARTALERRGVSDPTRQIALMAHRLTGSKSDAILGSQVSNLLVKNSPFTPAEVAQLRAHAADNGFDLLVAPGLDNGTLMTRLLETPEGELGAALGGARFRIAPVTDDRPFFFHVLQWSSLFTGDRMLWIMPGSSTGLIMLVMMLVQALLLGSALILLPLVRGDRPRLSRRQTGGFLLYFLGLGLGFLLIEISFVQKYVLVLGYPTYSLSVTIFSLLIFAALGAALSRRWWARPRPFLLVLLSATVLCVVLETLLLPWVRAALLASPLPTRILTTVLLQLPLGICLGMYFPTGVELLRRHDPRLVPWAWGVNGVASVVSAVLAVILGMSIGFSGVVLVAAAIYATGTLSLVALLPGLEASAGHA